MSETPLPQPFFVDLSGGVHAATGYVDHDTKKASEIYAREEMERLRAMGRPYSSPPGMPEVKEPLLPDNFQLQVNALDDEIFQRGLPVDRGALFSIGQKRFAELLGADRKAPRGSHGAGLDLTRFESVQGLLGVFASPSVPERKIREQATGAGRERDQVRNIRGFEDLWKATGERRETIDAVYDFRDRFESLCFGISLIEKLSKDGRVRSQFLAGGSGRRAELFHEWLSVVERPFITLALTEPRWHLLAWLADEKSPTPLPTDLASEWFSVRAPTEAQTEIAGAVLDGFIRDLYGWELWQAVGRQTRTAVHVERLSGWRQALAKRFPAIARFHDELRNGFFVDRGYGAEFHREFEPARHRAFFDRLMRKLLRQLSDVLAVGVAGTIPNLIVGRLEGQVLCKGKSPKRRAAIIAHLAKAFPGATFHLEVQS
jgi:hypothetical protein